MGYIEIDQQDDKMRITWSLAEGSGAAEIADPTELQTVTRERDHALNLLEQIEKALNSICSPYTNKEMSTRENLMWIKAQLRLHCLPVSHTNDGDDYGG